MDNLTRQTFKLHLPGLLQVLAEHLYSDQRVAIRELIQNAHDSCQRRLLEGGESGYRPRIEFAIDEERGAVTIRDNGAGLTAEEINDYLSTIGRSYTAELRERLAFLSYDDAASLIGQFGFGFLSAFLVASEVTLTTRSIQPGSPGLRWHSAGDEYYELSPAAREEAGTTVELAMKPEAAYLLDAGELRRAIRRYADFLPIPICFEGNPAPLNLTAPPWETATPEAATLDYIGRAFAAMPEPLCIIPLHDHTVQLDNDSISIPLQGFLFVPSASIASVHEYGDLTVYIRRMFICDGERDLMPPWARFVRGVIDSSALQPTASRESLHRDENFLLVQIALASQLGEALIRLAHDDPVTWKKLVRGHSDVITGWAVRDESFFWLVADLVTLRTSRGLLNLPDYLQITEGTLFYVTRELESLQDRMLAEGHAVPVIDASWFAVLPFLKIYAAAHPDIRLVALDSEVKDMFIPVDEQPFALLLARCHQCGIRARIAEFRPTEVPALMVYPEDAEFILEVRRARDAEELPGPLAGLLNEYAGGLAGEDELRGTLYLNASNALIRRLAEAPPGEAALDAALTLLHQIARLFSGRTLTAADAAAAFREVGRAVEALLG